MADTSTMKTALLVIDMQNHFTSMVTSSLSNVTKLICHFRSQGLPVIFTQHGHSDAELTPPFRNQLVKKWGPEGSIRIGTRAWEFIPDIVHLILGDALVVPKNTYDAFLGGQLEVRLRTNKVERVVVCGVMTDCCCDTTARGAFNRGFETWLVGDACGTATPAQHKRGLQVFEFAFGDVVSTEEVIKNITA
jgi:nicotinamidase-related amidase